MMVSLVRYGFLPFERVLFPLYDRRLSNAFYSPLLYRRRSFRFRTRFIPPYYQVYRRRFLLPLQAFFSLVGGAFFAFGRVFFPPWRRFFSLLMAFSSPFEGVFFRF
ncbi:unnamed protein product [Laminaria digitata]